MTEENKFCTFKVLNNGTMLIAMPDGTIIPGQMKSAIIQGSNEKTETTAPFARVILTLLIKLEGEK